MEVSRFVVGNKCITICGKVLVKAIGKGQRQRVIVYYQWSRIKAHFTNLLRRVWPPLSLSRQCWKKLAELTRKSGSTRDLWLEERNSATCPRSLLPMNSSWYKPSSYNHQIRICLFRRRRLYWIPTPKMRQLKLQHYVQVQETCCPQTKGEQLSFLQELVKPRQSSSFAFVLQVVHMLYLFLW